MTIDPSWMTLAWEEISSNPFDSLHPAQMPPFLVQMGWRPYLSSFLQQALIQRHDGHVWHRPHGQHVYLGTMNFGALKLCQKDVRLSKVADINAFVDAFAWWYDQVKVPQWFYYGWPGCPTDPWIGTSPEVRTAIMQECLNPLHKLKIAIGGNAGPAPVNLIIDTLGDKQLQTVTGTIHEPGGGQAGTPVYTQTDFGIAYDLAAQWDIPCHAEPRLAVLSPLLKTSSWAFSAEHEDRKADAMAWAAKRTAYGPDQRIAPWMCADPLHPGETEAQAFDRAAAALKRDRVVCVPMYHQWTSTMLKQRAAQV